MCRFEKIWPVPAECPHSKGATHHNKLDGHSSGANYLRAFAGGSRAVPCLNGRRGGEMERKWCPLNTNNNISNRSI